MMGNRHGVLKSDTEREQRIEIATRLMVAWTAGKDMDNWTFHAVDMAKAFILAARTIQEEA